MTDQKDKLLRILPHNHSYLEAVDIYLLYSELVLNQASNLCLKFAVFILNGHKYNYRTMSSKSEIKAKVDAKEYTLLKRPITAEDVCTKGMSAIWLFVKEIYTVKQGDPIPAKLSPLKNFVVAPDGVVISKSSGTGSVRNYLAKCSQVSTEDKQKYFESARSRNSDLKRKRKDVAKQRKLNECGIKLNDNKRMKVNNTVPSSVIDSEVLKLIKKEVLTKQLRLINEGLECPSMQDKDSFIDLLQLFLSIGATTKQNIDVRDLFLSSKNLTVRNIKEYKELLKQKEPIIHAAAKNKCLNIQGDLWDKHGVSVLGINGTYWRNEFQNPPWIYTNMALGISSFDCLLAPANFIEEVEPHTGVKIRAAIDKLLGDGKWGLSSFLESYTEFNGLPITITTDNGANIRKACGVNSHIGSAHTSQTTFK